MKKKEKEDGRKKGGIYSEKKGSERGGRRAKGEERKRKRVKFKEMQKKRVEVRVLLFVPCPPLNPSNVCLVFPSSLLVADALLCCCCCSFLLFLLFSCVFQLKTEGNKYFP